jgi:aspartate kinase
MSNLIVQKFGGSSVASVARIQRVAQIIYDSIERGSQVVAVVSAMGGETNRLDDMAREVGFSTGAELDVLLASGEQASAALLAMALQKLGVEAASFCGHQVRFLTSSDHQNARIQSVETHALQQAMEQAIVPIVAGFQGVNEQGALTTFGRGGSDLTAVALSAALRAKECQIYTDTDGVYTADPRVVADAQKLTTIALPLMVGYAQAGAKILQPRCLELATKESVPLRVLSSYGAGEGTLLTPEESLVAEGSVVQGIATQSGYELCRLSGLADRPGLLGYVLATLRAAGLPAGELLRYSGGELVVAGQWSADTALLEGVVAELSCELELQSGLSQLSLIGCGLTGDSGCFESACRALSQEGVDPLAMSAGSSRIEVLLADNQVARAIRCLHDALIKS